MRRIYLPQYAGEIITKADGSGQHGGAEPVLADGKLVDWKQGILSTLPGKD